MINRRFNKNFIWYQLEDLVLNCPKLNYKLNYKPGCVIDPRTKKLVPFDRVEDQIKKLARIPFKLKPENHFDLVEVPFGEMTDYEKEAKQSFENWSFLYQNKYIYNLEKES